MTERATPRARRVAPIAVAVALAGVAALAIAYLGFDFGSPSASSRTGGANSSDAAAKDSLVAAEGAAAADLASTKSRDVVSPSVSVAFRVTCR